MAKKIEEQFAAMLTKPKHVISFVGLERADIPYYQALVFASAGRTVLVLDNSYSNDLFASIPQVEGEDVLQIGNITFMKNVGWSQRLFDAFDHVIVYLGERQGDVTLDYLRGSSVRYIVTDYTTLSTRRIAEQLRELGKFRCKVLFLNKASGKISEELVCSEIGVPYHEQYSYTVTLDESDYKCFLNFERNGFQKLGAVSKELKTFYTDEFTYLTGINDKNEKKKLLNKAFAGKVE